MKQIKSLTYANSELGKEHAADKESSLDIRVLTEDQSPIDIEIQLKNEHNMVKRSLYYWARLYTQQLQEAKAYRKLHTTITINILDIRAQVEVIAMEDPMIGRALKDWDNLSADPELKELYFDRRKALLDRLAAVRESELL